MKKLVRIHVDTHWGMFYIIPSLSITYTRLLNGYYEITIHWLKFAISIAF
jgi:hypothetical protein